MEHASLVEAFKWGGWPAVFIVVAIAFAKWYCTKKLEQDKKFHDERLKEQHASQQMLGSLVNAVLALVYKTIDNQEAAKVMADISKQHLESVRASTRTEGQ
jgi:prolipoprotein diacylglyceryltransferase